MDGSAQSDTFGGFSHDGIEQDFVDTDAVNANSTHRQIQSDSERAPLNDSGYSREGTSIPRSYLNSSIPGEDRRAPTNTIDESVWDTLSRDLLAVWEKLRQVLWPKYLLGGMLQRGGGIGAAERGEGNVSSTGVRGFIGRWPDAEVVLQGGMSDGLRDWDLWGPLIFCLLLSLLLSLTKSNDQRTMVFTGIFALVWLGEVLVTAQIKLLGGNVSFFQSVCIIGYTLFPLVIAALFSAVHVSNIAKVPLDILLVSWALAAGISILGGSGVVKNRVGIAVYPLFVFYIALGCLCFI